MRIIAGVARGLQLESPKTMRVRPTQDRIRESLFSILMPYLEGARFLDLFAGTGANGIEALSRGAESATFVDSDERSLQFIKKNLARASLRSRAHIRRLQLPEQLNRLAEDQPFDVVFADPPYKFKDYLKLLDKLYATALLAPEALVIVEHDRHTEVPLGAAGWEQTRQSVYGDTALTFYRTT